MERQRRADLTVNTVSAAYAGVAVLAALPFVLAVTLPENMVATMVGEDGAVEWMGAMGWLVAAGCFVALLVMARRSKSASAVTTFWLVGLALMCVVAAGEEISWGQRLIGYETPGIIASENLQGEMNLHNLEALDVRLSVDGEKKTGLARWLTFNRISSLIWMGYLVALPVAVRLSRPLRTLAARWGPPVPPLGVAVAAVASYATFVVMSAFLEKGNPDHRVLNVSANEIKESVVAVLFACTAVIVLRRHGSSRLT